MIFLSWFKPKEESSQQTQYFQTRVSSVASIEYCEPKAYLNIIKGISEPVSMPLVHGTAHHYVRYYFYLKALSLAEQIDKTESVHAVYDLFKQYRVQAVEYALQKTVERYQKEGFQFTESDYMYLEQALLEDALRDAIVEAISVSSQRRFWIGYTVPKSLRLEEEIICEVKIRNRIFKLWAHPDLIFTDGLYNYVYDYKSGMPASLEVWIYPWNRLQLDGYSYGYEKAGLGKISSGAIIYLQDYSMFRFRITTLDPLRFESGLLKVDDWLNGEKPSYEEISACKNCQIREECKKEFLW